MINWNLLTSLLTAASINNDSIIWNYQSKIDFINGFINIDINIDSCQLSTDYIAREPEGEQLARKEGGNRSEATPVQLTQVINNIKLTAHLLAHREQCSTSKIINDTEINKLFN
jgi:hypothetical protein